MFYDNVVKICKDKGISPTTALRDLGFSTGNISKWKSGSVPNIDIALALARYLDVTLDYLCTLEVPNGSVAPADKEWLDIVARIPADRQEICKDFLKTHMTIPEKFKGKMQA